MAEPGYVQVAVDGAGKKIAMELGVDGYSNTVYKQKALLIDGPADALDQLLETDRKILACLRALLKIQQDSTNSRTTEEDYTSPTGGNFDG